MRFALSSIAPFILFGGISAAPSATTLPPDAPFVRSLATLLRAAIEDADVRNAVTKPSGLRGGNHMPERHHEQDRG